MARWVVFDPATAEVVKSKAGGRVDQQSITSIEQGGLVALAAAAEDGAVAVLPAADGQHALVLRFSRPPRPAATSAQTIAGTRVAPGGFLGLADEVLLDAEPEAPKKWWQKLLD